MQCLSEIIRGELLAERGVPKIADLAQRLRVSDRTLRRKLWRQGTSYNKLCSEIRASLAQDLLCLRGMTTEAIAAQLGYSDAANFRHAFKRWTGCPPRDYRRARKAGVMHADIAV